MKKFILSIIYFFACIFYINAQVFYGTTTTGGSYGGGTLYKYNSILDSLTVLKSFDTSLGTERNPCGSLLMATDGKLYGMKQYGGTGGVGVIFSFDPSSSIYRKLFDFQNANGAIPNGRLIQATDGKLYGSTSIGGGNNKGVIFSFDPVTSAYTKLKDFNVEDGGGPSGDFIQANDGKLYGMTQEGGFDNIGVIFSFDISSSIYSKLKDFSNLDGASPTGGLMQASDGKLYGTTRHGGGVEAGVIFSFNPLTSTFKKLMDFDNTNGAQPSGNLIQAIDGKLYGMTSREGSSTLLGGVIFSFDPSTSTYSKLKDFDDSTNGYLPSGSLMQAGDGKLYGMTSQGGANGYGTIFTFNLQSSKYTKLKDCSYSDGFGQRGNFLQATDGKLYGTTYYGGLGAVSGDGVIFSFDPSTNIYTTLGNTNSGTNPGGLIKAIDGKLYGTTSFGGFGSPGNGVIFSFDPTSSNYKKLMDFDVTTGGSPSNSASLLQAKDGNLYGMGGNTIFSFDPLTTIYKKQFTFDITNGSAPSGSLIQASDGKLYGMTSRGGVQDYGVIFSFDPTTATYRKLFDFDYSNGSLPWGSLLQASDGKLYGTTYYGGSALGVIFSFDLTTSIYTKLSDFNPCIDGPCNGGHPAGSLIQANDGKIYGTTRDIFYGQYPYGGPGGAKPNGGSGIFSFDPSTSIYTSIKDLPSPQIANGFNPNDLIQTSNGKLYGTTTIGGSKNLGVIFSFDPSTSNYIKLKDFNYTNGATPFSTFIEVNECTAPITYYKDADGDGFGDRNNTIKACTKPAGYVTNCTDCDDNNKTIHGPVTYFKDADGDGFGDPNNSIKACTKPAGYVINSTDCDDTKKAIHSPVTYYRDADRDGFGDANNNISVCKLTPPQGYVKNNFDCDDHKRANQFWNEKIRMCHNGKETCMPLKELLIRLCQGWIVGPCTGYKNKELFNSSTARTEDEAVDNKHQTVPNEYKLSSFPNPFAVSSTIQYELPSDSKVSIKVYDRLGRVVAVLVDQYKNAGTHTVTFKSGNLSMGVLYYRMIAISKNQQF